MARRVLVCGASIAGPVAAYWLERRGFDVVVLERAPRVRLGGQNIDISDAALDVVRMMGIEDRLRKSHTGELGLQFVDSANRARASFPAGERGSLTKEVEILRGDLAEILVEASGERVEYRFDDVVEGLHQREDSVEVSFRRGGSESFHAVVAADGMNSSTRSLILGDGDFRSYLGCWASYFTIPREDHDNDWWRWYTSPTGVIAFLRPDNQGTMRAAVNFLSDDGDYSTMSLAEKRELLQDRLEGAAWQCPRISTALNAVDDVYLGPLHQIKADRWWNGRAAVVGDAAYCPTPYTGMGTTFAIIGAYVIANELGCHDSPASAFQAYDQHLRGFVRASQKLPPGVPGLAYANSRFKVGIINTLAGIGASKLVQRLFSLFPGSTESSNKFTLPRYGDAD